MALLKLIFLAFIVAAASGCSHVSYLYQAGAGQFSLYNRERPLQEVIDDPTTRSETRERLKWIPEIKKTVESELGVEATKNYTTYVDLKRPYVIWSLTAAEPFKMELKQFKFPIVGAFPYLGFFKEELAHKWAREHEEAGYDTHVRGVTAYSTLGYLRDPLLSSMLSRRKADLVNLIFHESTHGQIYLKGQGSFNEQIASYIGDYGERLWIVRSFGENSKELQRWENDRADRRRFGVLLRAFAEELKNYYSSSETTPIEQRKLGKDERFKAFAQKLKSEPWKGLGYARAADMIKNNASLLAILTYEDEQDLFELINKRCGGSLKDALRFLKSFADYWSRHGAKASRHDAKITPQSVLYDRLRKLDARSAVCLDVNFN